MKTETNEEFVRRIMTYGCPTGPLVQPFVIEALMTYAKAILANPPPTTGLIDGAAWQTTAQFVLTEVERKYGK